MGLTPSMLTRNRSTEIFDIKHSYDLKNSTNNSLLSIFLKCKYLNSCLKSINNWKNNLETLCQIECYSNLKNIILTLNSLFSMEKISELQDMYGSKNNLINGVHFCTYSVRESLDSS